MKIFLREKDLVSTQTLMILNFETEASASEIRLDHDIMSNKLHFYSMTFIAGAIFFVSTSILITAWLFIPWTICFVGNFIVLHFARNHRRQANSWFVYAMWKYQEEFEVQLLAEEHLAENYEFYSRVFSSPTKASEQHPFEIET